MQSAAGGSSKTSWTSRGCIFMTEGLSTSHLKRGTLIMDNMGGRLLIPVGILAGLAGAVCGYFVAKQTLEQNIEDRLRHEFEEFKLDYAHLYGREFERDPEMDDDDDPSDIPEETASVQSQDLKRVMTDYTKIFTDENNQVQKTKTVRVKREVISPEGDPVTVVEDRTEIVNPKSYYIDADEFVNDRTNEKITVYYYPEIGELRDDRGQEFERADDIMPDDISEHFATDQLGQDVVYVRNEWTEIDYEVLRILGTPGGMYD